MKNLKQEDPETIVSRGVVFECPGNYPHENRLRLMLFEPVGMEEKFGLMVIGGRKSGLTLVVLPDEALSSPCSIKCGWFQENWNKWIYPDTDLQDVMFTDDLCDLLKEGMA